MRVALVIALALLLGGALAAERKPHPGPAPARAAEAQQRNETLKGDQLFEIHCRRCHQYPLTLPRKAARTVVLHMRVRAMLPADQAQRILQFLAP